MRGPRKTPVIQAHSPHSAQIRCRVQRGVSKILDIVAGLNGHRLFQTVEEVDRHINEERDAWNDVMADQCKPRIDTDTHGWK